MKFFGQKSQLLRVILLSIFLTACGYKPKVNSGDNGGGSDDSPNPIITKESTLVTEQETSCQETQIKEDIVLKDGNLKGLFNSQEKKNIHFEIRANQAINKLMRFHEIPDNELKIVNKYQVSGTLNLEMVDDFFDQQLLREKIEEYRACGLKGELGIIAEYILTTEIQTCVSKLFSTNYEYRAKMRCINRDTLKTETIEISD